jgi:Na+/proline symporter
VVLAVTVLGKLGDGSIGLGLLRLRQETPPAMLRVVPTDSVRVFVEWLSIFCVGALGNIPGQDLMQRVFAAKSPVVARRACFIAGFAYLGFGLIPVLLGLAAPILLPQGVDRAILPALASLFLSPATLIVFSVALISAVLSTIDSAILSPASVLAQNVFERVNRGRVASLTLNRLAVLLITAGSVGVAYLGESAYNLLVDAYEVPLVGLFVPLSLGLTRIPARERAAVSSMLVGAGLWLCHYVADWEYFLEPLAGRWDALVPAPLAIVFVSLVSYFLGNIGRANARLPDSS